MAGASGLPPRLKLPIKAPTPANIPSEEVSRRECLSFRRMQTAERRRKRVQCTHTKKNCHSRRQKKKKEKPKGRKKKSQSVDRLVSFLPRFPSLSPPFVLHFPTSKPNKKQQEAVARRYDVSPRTPLLSTSTEHNGFVAGEREEKKSSLFSFNEKAKLKKSILLLSSSTCFFPSFHHLQSRNEVVSVCF